MKSKRISRILAIVLTMIFSCAVFVFFNDSSSKQTAYALNENQIENKIDYESIVEYSCDNAEFENTRQVQKFAEDNEYFYFSKDGKFYFYNKFALKTLSVLGEFDSSNFKNVTKTGSTTQLKFDTIEETKQAYNLLTADEDLIVVIDRISQANVLDSSTISTEAYGWGYDAIDAEPYHEYLTETGTTEEVVVAVIDTGINTSHTMLKDRIVKNSAGNYVGIAATSTTYTYSGYSFEDDNGHGTHVSGIICDTTPENVKILPVKLLDKNGSFSYSSLAFYEDLFNQIVALKNTYNIVCVNMSFGADGASRSEVAQVNKYLKDILIKNNILPICAAGNKIPTSVGGDGTCHDIDVDLALPASCVAGVTVSALKKTTNRTSSGTVINYIYDSSYSYYGSLVDISAPGTSIKSAWISSSNRAGSNYRVESGTSMATPYVSAVVAMICLDPIYSSNLVIADVEQRMYELAIDLGSAGKDNYYGYGMVSLKAFKGDIAYTAQNTTVDYDGEYHNISVTVANVADYTIKYGLMKNAINLTTVDGHSEFKNWSNGQLIVYFIISAEDMTDTFGFAYLQINKSNISISVENQYGVYGDNPTIDQSKYSILSGNIYGEDELNVKLSTNATRKSVPGQYSILHTCQNTNYNLICSTEGKYIISRRDISIKLNDQQFYYGDELALNNDEYTILSGSLAGDDLSLALTTTAYIGSAVGEYQINLYAYNDACYNMVECQSANLTILKRPISIQIHQKAVYGDSFELDTLNYTIISGSVYDNDKLLLTLSTTAEQGSNVGEYPINVDEYNQNYDLTLTTSVFEIEKRQIEVVIGNTSSKSGEAIDLSKVKVDVFGVINDENINLSLFTTATTESLAGWYAISMTYNNPNYNAVVTDGKYHIYYTLLHVTIKNQNSTYGNEINLNHTLFDVEEDVQKEDINLVLNTNATSNSNIGDYKIFAESYADEFELICVNGTLNITARPITLTINQSVGYGDDFVFDGNFVDIDSGVVNNDDLQLELSSTRLKFSVVGEYELNVVQCNPNYVVTLSSNSKLVVVPRQIEVEIGNLTKIYGAPISFDGVSVDLSNVLNGDNLNYVLNTTAQENSDVGEYEIGLTCANPNYDVQVNKGKYIVVPKTVSIQVLDAKATYGDEIDENLFDYVCDDEIINKSDLQVKLNSTAKQFDAVGTYPIKVQSNNANYLIEAKLGKLKITPRKLKVELQPQTKKHLAGLRPSQDAYTIVEGELCGEDDLNLKIDSKLGVLLLWGEYDLTAKSDNSNYEVEVVAAKVKVEYSSIDTFVIATLALVAVIVVVFIVKRNHTKTKGKIRYYNDAMKISNKNKK